MLHSLTGHIVYLAEQTIALQMQFGIAWEMIVSSIAIQRWNDSKQRYTVYTHLVYRDDTIQLYGFVSVVERELFRKLVKVNGIGPKAAIQILSHIEVPLLHAAIADGDVAALGAIPKIGQKSAQKIILSLRGTLKNIEVRADNEIEVALREMGYDEQQVHTIVTELQQKIARDAYKTEQAYEAMIFQKALQQLR